MLTEDKRIQLDGIVSQMTSNRESDDAINFVINDFKNKYSTPEPETSFTERTAKVLDMFFGGGKVGEAIGTEIAKRTVPKEQRQFVSPRPSVGKIAGSALQSVALFAPVGTVAKGITGGVRALGLVKGASATGKIGSGVFAGELFDVASNLQQGKTGKDALTPGLGSLIGGGIPAAGVLKNFTVRFGHNQAPRVINSLIKPLAKDFSYGKNPGRAIAEEGIVANNFDDLIASIRASRQRIGQEIGKLGDNLSAQPQLNIRDALNPLDDAIKIAASQNNTTLLSRLNNVKRALTEVLEPTFDDAGNLGIKSLGSKNLESLTFKQTRNILGEIGDLTAFTGNPSDDKLVNSALKQVYGKVKEKSLNLAREIDPVKAKQFEKLTEKYGDLSSAEIAAKYRDKIVERQALIGLSPQNVGIGAGLITAVATGGATFPSVLIGVSAGVIDKLAQTPAFKTRLAYILSKKTQAEVNYLVQKLPALKAFFSTKKGLTPGDVLLGKKAENVEKGITEFIKKPKLGLSIDAVPKQPSLLQEAKKYKSAEEFVKAQNKTATGAKVPDTLKIYALDDKDLGQIYRQSGIKSSAYPTDFIAKNDIPELKIKKGDKVSILANDKDAKRFTIENIPERKTESGTYSKSSQIGDLVEGYSRQDQIDFINKNFAKEGLTKSQLTDIYNKAVKNKQLDPLIAEARKYKTAEEFVKAQGTPVYHGTNADFSEFGKTSAGMNFFTSSKGVAADYGKNIKETFLDIKNPKIVDMSGYNWFGQRVVDRGMGLPESINKGRKTNYVYLESLNAKRAGYDGVIFKNVADSNTITGGKAIGDTYVVFDPKNIKTKSQLIDIWNKANKK